MPPRPPQSKALNSSNSSVPAFSYTVRQVDVTKKRVYAILLPPFIVDKEVYMGVLESIASYFQPLSSSEQIRVGGLALLSLLLLQVRVAEGGGTHFLLVQLDPPVPSPPPHLGS